MLRRLLQQGASVAGIRIVGTGLSVGVTIAIARVFGADALGIYAYCIALMAISAVPISNGWSSMLLRTVSGHAAIDGEAAAMTRMGAIGAVVIVLLAGIIGFALIRWGTSDVARGLQPIAFTVIALLGFALLCDQLSAMRMAAIRGIDRPATAQLPEMLVRPCVLLIGIGAAWLWTGTDGAARDVPKLFAALAAAACLAAIFGQLVLRRVSPPVSPTAVTFNERRAWIASAAALAGSAGLVQLNGYIDMLILGSFVSSAELGLYRTALQVATLASFGYVALNMLAGQRFARFRKVQDQAGMRSTATWLARLGLATALPLPVILLLFGRDLFAFLFGIEFSGAAVPSLIVASGLAFSAAIGMARTLLVMHHFEFLVMRTTVAALAINIGLCLLLIPHFGMEGAAWANLAATCSWNLLLWLLARRKTGIDSSALGLARRELP